MTAADLKLNSVYRRRNIDGAVTRLWYLGQEDDVLFFVPVNRRNSPCGYMIRLTESEITDFESDEK